MININSIFSFINPERRSIERLMYKYHIASVQGYTTVSGLLVHEFTYLIGYYEAAFEGFHDHEGLLNHGENLCENVNAEIHNNLFTENGFRPGNNQSESQTAKSFILVLTTLINFYKECQLLKYDMKLVNHLVFPCHFSEYDFIRYAKERGVGVGYVCDKASWLLSNERKLALSILREHHFARVGNTLFSRSVDIETFEIRLQSYSSLFSSFYDHGNLLKHKDALLQILTQSHKEKGDSDLLIISSLVTSFAGIYEECLNKDIDLDKLVRLEFGYGVKQKHPYLKNELLIGNFRGNFLSRFGLLCKSRFKVILNKSLHSDSTVALNDFETLCYKVGSHDINKLIKERYMYHLTTHNLYLRNVYQLLNDKPFPRFLSGDVYHYYIFHCLEYRYESMHVSVVGTLFDKCLRFFDLIRKSTIEKTITVTPYGRLPNIIEQYRHLIETINKESSFFEDEPEMKMLAIKHDSYLCHLFSICYGHEPNENTNNYGVNVRAFAFS